MLWTVFWIIAAAILVLFAVLAILISKKLFKIACVRGEPLSVGDGFEKQFSEHKDAWKEGKELYESLQKEDVFVKSDDGLTLHGELIRNKASKKLLVEVHGFRSNPQHDFVTSMPYFYGKGFSLLLLDHRAHARSEGEYITYGTFERYDLLKWLDLAIKMLGDDVEIILHGISMGASTVLMASGLDLPKNVKGIIADSGYTSAHDIFVRVLRHSFNAPPFPLLNIAECIAKKKANFDFKAASTVDALAKNTLPVLFVHGEDDDFVPIEMSEVNFEATAAEKSFVRVEGAYHACAYLIDREKCERALDEFLGKIFEK